MIPHIMMLSLRKRLFDPIDPRKVHASPASRLGGVTFFPAILFSVFSCISINILFPQFFDTNIVPNVRLILVVLSLLMLYLIGVSDDMVGASFKVKFFVQIIAAILIISSDVYFKTLHGIFGIYEIPSYIGVPVTLLFYVFVTNSINLIDGIDGLASLLSIMALAVYSALLFLSSGLTVELLFTTATLGALVPFCYRNIFGVRRAIKSKIFMGDTGALVIGALLGFAAVSVWNIAYDNHLSYTYGRMFSVLSYTMLLVPCLDVVRIVIHRYRSHKPLFMPDKNHIHHKFMAIGFTPHQALFSIVTMNLLFLILNIVLALYINIIWVVVIDLAVWSAFHITLTKRIASYESSSEQKR